MSPHSMREAKFGDMDFSSACYSNQYNLPSRPLLSTKEGEVEDWDCPLVLLTRESPGSYDTTLKSLEIPFIQHGSEPELRNSKTSTKSSKMADPNISQYKYSAMSNLVLQADRRLYSRNKDENTGDPESLAGRLNIRDMGSRVAREQAPKQKKMGPGLGMERGTIHEGEDVLERERRKRKSGEPAQTRGAGILSAGDALIEGLKYRPRTPATRATYDLLLTVTANALGDVSQEIVRSAADAILEFLKDENMKDLDKKKEVDEIVGTTMTPKEFNELVNLGKKITDYDAQDEDEDMADGDEAELDDRQGVAVVFDEDDEDEDGIARTYEVRDEDDDSDDEDDVQDQPDDEAATAGGAGAPDVDPDDEDTGMVLDGGVADSSRRKREDSDLVPIHEIDAYWLQRQIGSIYSDAHIQQQKTQDALQILSGKSLEGEDISLRDIENDLMDLFDYEHPEMVGKFVTNRDRIVWATRWRRVAEDADARNLLEVEMVEAGHRAILDELVGNRDTGAEGPRPSKKMKLDLMDIDIPKAQIESQEEKKDGTLSGGLQPQRLINLENLVFEQGNHLMTNPKVVLPQGSTKRTFKGYEEIHVPAPKARIDPGEKLIPTSDLPDWARQGFGSAKSLNRIQSKCYPSAFGDDGNMLVCAPTGSGKTNVAMLTMLREIGKHRNPETGEIMLDDFKIIYIAPLKALVQEQVGNFGKRLEPYGIRVSELTGDRQLTKQQIADTQVIVTTPEKWDVITRKATDLSYTRLVRLIIIDEIHLLHDDRGPVLESIVSRTIRKIEQTGDPVRIVGLSATLPNYRDVATFLRVDPEKGLFHFDGSFRPCPLRQEFIGVTDKKAIKMLKTMSDVCYAKVMEHVGTNQQQMLIFVHSRKETAKTAKYIRDKAVEAETIGQIMRTDAASRQILQEEADQVNDANLKDLMPYGFGIHHAGMNAADRSSVEDLFSDGSLRVLVCTATLAWGVNLPAHTVIIKGTQVYSPEKGSWVELSPQDVLQMLGRAGRPQYDVYGEGIIITSQAEIQYYLSLLNQQLPIESQLMSKLADNLNAEIVLGNVQSRDQGVEWLGYTYLFVRMIRSPGLYSVGADYSNDDALEQKRVDLIHSAAVVLEKAGLVKYDKTAGKLQATDLGRIASHYYITHHSMLTYNMHLQPSISTIELFRVFALSDEFKYIPVRQDEKLELAKLLGRVPIPVKEGMEEPQAKINVLLQAFISRLKLEGLALMADLVYVTQSAGRILRAIFEICLRKGWASVAKIALDLCKMAEKRMWPTMTPLRQFPRCPREYIQKAERMEVPWPSYFDLDPPRMGELLGLPKAGRVVCDLVSKFPRLEVQAQVQPMTRSMLHFELTITPNFVWDDALHGTAESFWIIVEDCDGEEILFHDQFILRKEFAEGDMTEHLVDFTVPISEPIPPNYFITLISDRWMHSETRVPVSFQKLILPERFPPHTQLLDLQPVPVQALKVKEYVDLYPNWDRFNKIQTQVFKALYDSDDSVFVGAPTGSGKTVCAEFALLKHWKNPEAGKAVYVAPFQELVDNLFADWQERLSVIAGGKTISTLTGEITADLRILDRSDLILATPTQWDVLSRQWQRRKNVQNVELFIADELHMLGGENGAIYEVVVSRMQYIHIQLENTMRIIGLSVPLSNARDVGEWIGANKHTIYNFSPMARPVGLELHIQSFNIPHFPSLMMAMARPAYQAVLQLSPDKPAIIFVPGRKQVRATAVDILSACIMDDDDQRFLHTNVDELAPFLERINERSLAESLSHGIGYYHEALSTSDKRIVSHLFKIGAIQVMLASRDVCWEIPFTAHLVIIMGTQHFQGREHRYVDYQISEILQMFGRSSRPGQDRLGKGVLMVPQVRREYYKKFLNEALPIESHLALSLHDAFVTEISTKTITSTQDAVDWTTYTYFYRRLLANPSFYGLNDTSHEGLSTFLSELVETTLKELSEAKIIDLDDEDDSVSPLNPAMIAAYYNISFITMQTFLLSLTARTKLKGMLEIVTSATEFEGIQIRRHEDHILRRIYDRVPVKMAEPAYDSPHFKAMVLLQAHFSRMQLPIDLAKDQEVIVSKILSLLSACVDVLSSEGHINAMNAMEMSQMVVQGMWDRDSPLLQIPHFDNRIVEILARHDVKDVDEFMTAMDPSENPDQAKLVAEMGLTNRQLVDAANFTNSKYPSLELEFDVLEKDDVTAGSPSYLAVKISRETEDEDEDDEGPAEVDLTVHAPFYPAKKLENWWLVVAEEKTRSLLAIKRVTIGKDLATKLEYVVPTPGKKDLTLFLMSDSYVGVDQSMAFSVDVAEGMDEDENEEDEEEE
ncbi:Pre-mRNA-splicing helicase BRR2 [Rhinocladiella similis]